MKILKSKAIAVIAAASMALTLSACGGGDNGKTSDKAKSTAASGEKAKDEIGINEIAVGDSGPQTVDALDVNAVYFQAIDLENGSMSMPAASESDMHFEIDIKTNSKAQDWGYEEGQFLPYLDVNAVVTNTATGEKTDLGTMMPMIASDGPHYGNNIKLAPGRYDVTISIGSPADKFMLHTGKDSSGVKGRFWKEPLKVEFKNWEWDGQIL